MRHHTVTAIFSASQDEVFAYLADIDNLPHWATEFARELKLVDSHPLTPPLMACSHPAR